MTSIDDASYDLLAGLREQIGIPLNSARLLHHHSNAIYVLPAAGVVARIATNPAALDRVSASLRVTRRLADDGFPCTRPAQIAGQPFTVGDRVVSLWEYVAVVAEPQPTAGELATILRDLHARSELPLRLEPLTDPLSSVAAAAEQHRDDLTRDQTDWLLERIGQLRTRWDQITVALPPGLIHGDAHPGNLMRLTDGGLVLGDWDQVAVGPREWDVAQICYTSRRFGCPAAGELDGFVTAYGWDPRTWDGLADFIAVREISGLSPYIRNAKIRPALGEELSRRLRNLQTGDTTSRWRRPGQFVTAAR